MWRKAMLYLGLGPDEEYDDYDACLRRPAPTRRAAPGAAPQPPSSVARPDEPSAIGAVRPISAPRELGGRAPAAIARSRSPPGPGPRWCGPSR